MTSENLKFKLKAIETKEVFEMGERIFLCDEEYIISLRYYLGTGNWMYLLKEPSGQSEEEKKLLKGLLDLYGDKQ